MPDFGWEDDVEETDDAEESAGTPEEDESLSSGLEGPSDDSSGSTTVGTESSEESTDDAVSAPDDDVTVGADSAPASSQATTDGGDPKAQQDGSAEDPFENLATGSMDLSAAQNASEKRRVMLWGPPATGKTHSVYTARTPLAIVDTERKAHDLADKFDVEPAKVRIWPVSDWGELEGAVEQALDWLQAWHDEKDERGTLAIDSMSDAWEWAKVDYIHRYYIEPDPTGKYEDPSDVDLKSGLESNDPDWPKIKQQHNDLRDKMVDSEFDLVWTAMAKEDYNEKIETGMSETPYTWHGETNNDHKVNYIIRHRETDDGHPVGDLTKPGTTQHSFTGLDWPTLPKVFEVVQDIKDAENSPDPVDPSEVTEHDVNLVKGKPVVAPGGDDGE